MLQITNMNSTIVARSLKGSRKTENATEESKKAETPNPETRLSRGGWLCKAIS